MSENKQAPAQLLYDTCSNFHPKSLQNIHKYYIYFFREGEGTIRGGDRGETDGLLARGQRH